MQNRREPQQDHSQSEALPGLMAFWTILRQASPAPSTLLPRKITGENG